MTTTDIRGLTTNKEVKQLLKELRDRGTWTFGRTGGGHIKLVHQSGQKVYMSSTPSDRRAVEHTRVRVDKVDARHQTQEQPARVETKETNVAEEPQTRKKGRGPGPGGGRRGRTNQLIAFMRKHPDKILTTVEIAEAVFPEEFGQDRNGAVSRVSTAMGRVVKIISDIERVGRGQYVYRPEDSSNPGEDAITEDEVPDEAPQMPSAVAAASDERELFEEVARLADGRLLVQNGSGDLYVASRVEL